MLVLSWIKTNLKWWLISRLGFLKKKALEDLSRYRENLKDFKEMEKPFPTEMEIGNDYIEFWKRAVPFSVLQRVEIFLVVATISFLVFLIQLLKLDNASLTAVLQGKLTPNQYILLVLPLLLFLLSLYIVVSDSLKLNNFPEYREGDEIRAERWLTLIGEKERKGLPFWINFVSLVALFIEAFVFGITVFTVVTDLITKQVAIVVGIIIGIVAAIILHTLSFKAGKSLYTLSLTKNLLSRMRNDAKRRLGNRTENVGEIALESNLYKELAALELGLSSTNIEDSELLKAHHTYTLVQKPKESFLKKYGLLILSFLLVITIGGLLFFYRLEVYKNTFSLTQESVVVQEVDSVNYESLIGNDVTDKDIIDSNRKVVMAAIFLLYLFFIMAYILVVFLGFYYSFSCEKSEEFSKLLRYADQIKKWRLKVESVADKRFIEYFSNLTKVIEEQLGKTFDREPYTLKKYMKYKHNK